MNDPPHAGPVFGRSQVYGVPSDHLVMPCVSIYKVGKAEYPNCHSFSTELRGASSFLCAVGVRDLCSDMLYMHLD